MTDKRQGYAFLESDKENTLSGHLDLPRMVAALALAAVFGGVLVIHAFHYIRFIADDALISLRYADRLIQGQGLTWTDGRPVEGYSNLLWILLVAFFGLSGMDLITAARLLGFLGMGTVVGVVAVRYLLQRSQSGALPGLIIGILFFVGAAPVAVWTVGGLEQPLLCAMLAFIFPLYWKARESSFTNRGTALVLALLLGTLCLTRLDGPLFTVAIIVSALICANPDERKKAGTFALIVISLPVVFYAGQLAFRLAYYGTWVPNSALVKLTPSLYYLGEGLKYVWHGIMSLFPTSIIAFAFLLGGTISRASRQRFLPLMVTAIVWIAYIIAIGGDIFPAYRHFLPVIVLLMYALIEGIMMTWAKMRSAGLIRGLVFAGIFTAAAITFFLQFTTDESHRALNEQWEWKGRALGMTLKDAFSTEKPLLAVTAAGCLPFWSELPSVDMLGLNDYYLPRHRPENMGIGFLGHELGNIDYILGLAPDIVVFHTGVQPEYGFGAELLADTSFARNYRKLRVATAVSPHYTALIWIRERSARVGIKRENGKITIPAYLINASDQTIASLADDHFVVHIDSDHPAGVEVPDVSKWDAVIVASQNSDNINCRAEPSGRGVLISLTTNSPKPLAVDSIILRTTASADSDVSPKTVTPGISCSGASTCVINPGDDLPKHHP